MATGEKVLQIGKGESCAFSLGTLRKFGEVWYDNKAYIKYRDELKKVGKVVPKPDELKHPYLVKVAFPDFGEHLQKIAEFGFYRICSEKAAALAGGTETEITNYFTLLQKNNWVKILNKERESMAAPKGRPLTTEQQAFQMVYDFQVAKLATELNVEVKALSKEQLDNAKKIAREQQASEHQNWKLALKRVKEAQKGFV